jgi:hypothetical protein
MKIPFGVAVTARRRDYVARVHARNARRSWLHVGDTKVRDRGKGVAEASAAHSSAVRECPRAFANSASRRVRAPRSSLRLRLFEKREALPNESMCAEKRGFFRAFPQIRKRGFTRTHDFRPATFRLHDASE